MHDVNPDAGPALQALATHLRDLRQASGITCRELAQRTANLSLVPCSLTTVSQATSGTRLPRPNTVKALAWAAYPPGLNPGPASLNQQQPIRPAARRARARVNRALRLWKAARAEQARAALPPLGPGRHITRIRSLAGFRDALTRLYLEAGAPSLRTLEDRTNQAGHRIPHNRCQNILTGTALPTRPQLEALLTALGIAHPSTLQIWQTSRTRVQEALRRHAPRPEQTSACADADPRTQKAIDRSERQEEIHRKVGKTPIGNPHEDIEEHVLRERLWDGYDWQAEKLRYWETIVNLTPDELEQHLTTHQTANQ